MSRDPETEQYISDCIGPRVAGTLWRDRAGNTTRVLAVDRDPAGGELWTVTEVDEAGQQVGQKRTHCTPWDPDWDHVISQPQEATR